MSGVPRTDFIEEAMRVIREAEGRGIALRVIGAVALRIKLPAEFRKFHEQMLNRELSDIDYLSYSKHTVEVRKLFKELGYVWDEAVARIAFSRDIFHDEVNNRHSDVFYDKLMFCHDVDFRGRLELDYPTITLTDYALEKLQIVQISDKDVKDLIVLFMNFPVENSDKGAINKKYISNVLSKDWGFYYTVTTNLRKLGQLVEKYKIPKDKVDLIRLRINDLLEAIENEPKSFGWKMRAKVGTKKKWYREVEEVIR
jgi:hypothetical protein